MSERAVEIAKAAVQKVFRSGGETTVTLPKDWYLQVTAMRAVRGETEINVLLSSVVKGVEEPLFYKKVTAVDIHVREPFSLISYIGGVSTVTAIISGRFKLKVEHSVGAEGVTVTKIEARKV